MGLHDLEGFSGQVPLMPLPNVVLFPQTVLPLHIFEPRYREMTEGTLEGERLIAMALLKPGWQPEYYGNPAVHPVVGVGKIISDRRLDDGRFNLLVYGLCRARIVEVVSEHPYRTARVDILQDRTDAAREKELSTKRLGLLAIYTSLVRDVFKNEKLMPDADISVGTLCDVLAAFVDADVREKQAVLEELEVGARIDRVVQLLRRSPLSAAPCRSGLREGKKNAWPPDASIN